MFRFYAVFPLLTIRRFLATFYSLVYLYLLQRPDIAELTIEDPSEAFQDMRDKVDYSILSSASVFSSLTPSTLSSNPSWRETTRKEWKLATRQFNRLLELSLKAELKEGDKVAEREWRLLVKERLCRFNYEILSGMEKSERRETLQQTFEAVEDEYDRLLDAILV